LKTPPLRTGGTVAAQAALLRHRLTVDGWTLADILAAGW